MVLQIGLADGGADDGCDFKVREIALTLQIASLMTREIELQKSVEGGIAYVDAGDERDFEVRLERAGDGAHLVDRTGLSQRVLHEITGTERKRIQQLGLFEALFEEMETQYRTGLGVFVGAEAAEGDDMLNRAV
jgi:hypothetical protein